MTTQKAHSKASALSRLLSKRFPHNEVGAYADERSIVVFMDLGPDRETEHFYYGDLTPSTELRELATKDLHAVNDRDIKALLAELSESRSETAVEAVAEVTVEPWTVTVEGAEVASAGDVDAIYVEFYRVADENPGKYVTVHRPGGAASAARNREGRFL